MLELFLFDQILTEPHDSCINDAFNNTKQILIMFISLEDLPTF